MEFQTSPERASRTDVRIGLNSMEMGNERSAWGRRIEEALNQYGDGQIGLDAVAEVFLAGVSETTSRRGEIYESAYSLAAELERHHDLRTSPWNTPDDVGPEDDRDLEEILSQVRRIAIQL